MMKVLFLVLCTLPLVAECIYQGKAQSFKQCMRYSNATADMPPAQVLGFKPYNAGSVKGVNKSLWTRIVLYNPFHTPQHVVLYQPHLSVTDMTLYLYRDGKLQRTFKRGSLVMPNDYSFYERSNALTLTLPPQDSITLIGRIGAIQMMDASWNIAPLEEYRKEQLLELVIGIFLAVFLLTVSLVSFAFYIKTRRKEFLYYGLFLLCYIAMAFLENGFWIWLNPGIDPRFFYSSLNVFGALVSVPALLFTQTLFDTKLHFKRFHKIFNLLLLLFSALTLFFVSGYFTTDVYLFLPVLLILLLVAKVIRFIFNVYAILRGFAGDRRPA